VRHHDLAERRPADLSTGQRRLVELARVVAGGFASSWLDEPSSGLDHTETDRFGDALRTLVEERGTGLLIVEHDMAPRHADLPLRLRYSTSAAHLRGEPEAVVASDVVRPPTSATRPPN